MTENKVFFIINKHAGTGFQSGVEGRIIKTCAALNLECVVEYTRRQGHATQLALQAVDEGFTRVFAMGGDGTVNEVAKSLVHTQTALGILPKGSGNGLARHLHIPLGVKKAIRLLEHYQVIEMDTLLINQKLSVNVSGIGFDAHVASLFGENGKRGLFNYIRLVLREFSRFKEFEADVIINGKSTTQKSFVIALANSSQFGNNARVAPFASVCDGEMNVCFIRKAPLTKAAGLILKMYSGKIHESPYVDTGKTKAFTAECKLPVPFHIDGEAWPPTREFSVEIQPASLKMIVPENASGF
jgi:diacylglycerol kinase (ATP)